jgi:hypothetical protein
VLVQIIPWVLFAMGVVAAGCSIVSSRDIGNPLWYIFAAAICTRLPDLTRFKGGGFEAELERRVVNVEEKTSKATLAAAQALATAKTTQGELIDRDERIQDLVDAGPAPPSELEFPEGVTSANMMGSVGASGDHIGSADKEIAAFYHHLKLLRPLSDSTDTWKGISEWNGEARGDGDKRRGRNRALEVKVELDPNAPTFFLASMRVTSTNTELSPLTHPVAFLLPTVFARQKVVVLPINGEALLTKRLVRPCTIGLLDDTLEILEYDLSKDTHLPGAFRDA